ncbi:hypothetical protein HK102_009505 [Quaeritorhiza haematococci]|nr:hypothetical protein HK102_009505 [Quaeritorhiza haematococci]
MDRPYSLNGINAVRSDTGEDPEPATPAHFASLLLKLGYNHTPSSSTHPYMRSSLSKAPRHTTRPPIHNHDTASEVDYLASTITWAWDISQSNPTLHSFLGWVCETLENGPVDGKRGAGGEDEEWEEEGGAEEQEREKEGPWDEPKVDVLSEFEIEALYELEDMGISLDDLLRMGRSYDETSDDDEAPWIESRRTIQDLECELQSLRDQEDALDHELHTLSQSTTDFDTRIHGVKGLEETIESELKVQRGTIRDDTLQLKLAIEKVSHDSKHLVECIQGTLAAEAQADGHNDISLSRQSLVKIDNEREPRKTQGDDASSVDVECRLEEFLESERKHNKALESLLASSQRTKVDDTTLPDGVFDEEELNRLCLMFHLTEEEWLNALLILAYNNSRCQVLTEEADREKMSNMPRDVRYFELLLKRNRELIAETSAQIRKMQEETIPEMVANASHYFIWHDLVKEDYALRAKYQRLEHERVDKALQLCLAQNVRLNILKRSMDTEHEIARSCHHLLRSIFTEFENKESALVQRLESSKSGQAAVIRRESFDQDHVTMLMKLVAELQRTTGPKQLDKDDDTTRDTNPTGKTSDGNTSTNNNHDEQNGAISSMMMFLPGNVTDVLRSRTTDRIDAMLRRMEEIRVEQGILAQAMTRSARLMCSSLNSNSMTKQHPILVPKDVLKLQSELQECTRILQPKLAEVGRKRTNLFGNLLKKKPRDRGSSLTSLNNTFAPLRPHSNAVAPQEYEVTASAPALNVAVGGSSNDSGSLFKLGRRKSGRRNSQQQQDSSTTASASAVSSNTNTSNAGGKLPPHAENTGSATELPHSISYSERITSEGAIFGTTASLERRRAKRQLSEASKSSLAERTNDDGVSSSVMLSQPIPETVAETSAATMTHPPPMVATPGLSPPNPPSPVKNASSLVSTSPPTSDSLRTEPPVIRAPSPEPNPHQETSTADTSALPTINVAAAAPVPSSSSTLSPPSRPGVLTMQLSVVAEEINGLDSSGGSSMAGRLSVARQREAELAADSKGSGGKSADGGELSQHTQSRRGSATLQPSSDTRSRSASASRSPTSQERMTSGHVQEAPMVTQSMPTLTSSQELEFEQMFQLIEKTKTTLDSEGPPASSQPPESAPATTGATIPPVSHSASATQPVVHPSQPPSHTTSETELQMMSLDRERASTEPLPSRSLTSQGSLASLGRPNSGQRERASTIGALNSNSRQDLGSTGKLQKHTHAYSSSDAKLKSSVSASISSFTNSASFVAPLSSGRGNQSMGSSAGKLASGNSLNEKPHHAPMASKQPAETLNNGMLSPADSSGPLTEHNTHNVPMSTPQVRMGVSTTGTSETQPQPQLQPLQLQQTRILPTQKGMPLSLADRKKMSGSLSGSFSSLNRSNSLKLGAGKADGSQTGSPRTRPRASTVQGERPTLEVPGVSSSASSQTESGQQASTQGQSQPPVMLLQHTLSQLAVSPTGATGSTATISSTANPGTPPRQRAATDTTVRNTPGYSNTPPRQRAATMGNQSPKPVLAQILTSSTSLAESTSGLAREPSAATQTAPPTAIPNAAAGKGVLPPSARPRAATLQQRTPFGSNGAINLPHGQMHTTSASLLSLTSKTTIAPSTEPSAKSLSTLLYPTGPTGMGTAGSGPLTGSAPGINLHSPVGGSSGSFTRPHQHPQQPQQQQPAGPPRVFHPGARMGAPAPVSAFQNPRGGMSRRSTVGTTTPQGGVPNSRMGPPGSMMNGPLPVGPQGVPYQVQQQFQPRSPFAQQAQQLGRSNVAEAWREEVNGFQHNGVPAGYGMSQPGVALPMQEGHHPAIGTPPTFYSQDALTESTGEGSRELPVPRRRRSSIWDPPDVHSLEDVVQQHSTIRESVVDREEDQYREEDPSMIDCFGKGEGTLFMLEPGWEKQQFEDAKYNIWRQALLEILQQQIDYPLIMPPDLTCLLGEDFL